MTSCDFFHPPRNQAEELIKRSTPAHVSHMPHIAITLVLNRHEE